jgi:hypothetical protein
VLQVDAASHCKASQATQARSPVLASLAVTSRALSRVKVCLRSKSEVRSAGSDAWYTTHEHEPTSIFSRWHRHSRFARAHTVKTARLSHTNMTFTVSPGIAASCSALSGSRCSSAQGCMPIDVPGAGSRGPRLWPFWRSSKR